MRDTFYKLAIVFARRKTVKQKIRFLTYLTKALETLGIRCTKLVDRTGKPVKQQLFVGDVETSESVVVSAYPSQNRQMFINRFYPFADEKNRKNELINLAADIALAMLLLCLASLLFYCFYSYKGIGSEWVRPCALVLGAIFTMNAYSATIGCAAYINYSQSGALCLLITLAGEKKKGVSCVLCDSTVGSADYLKNYKFKTTSLDDKTVVMLDSFAAGRAVMIAYSPNACDEARKLAEGFGNLTEVISEERDFSYMSALKDAKCLYVASGDIDGNGAFYVRDWKSNRNKRVDFELLERAKAAIDSIL